MDTVKWVEIYHTQDDLHQNKYHPIFRSPSFAGASDKLLLSAEFAKKQCRSFIRRNMKHFDPNKGYLVKHWSILWNMLKYIAQKSYRMSKCFDSFFLKFFRNGWKIFDWHQNKYHPIFRFLSFAGASDKMLLSAEFAKKQLRSFISRDINILIP